MSICQGTTKNRYPCSTRIKSSETFCRNHRDQEIRHGKREREYQQMLKGTQLMQEEIQRAKETEQVEEEKLLNYQALQLLSHNNGRTPLITTPLSVDFDGSEEEVINHPIKQNQYFDRSDIIRLKGLINQKINKK